MSQWERIPFNGRDIYLVTGIVSQTVNVCTEKNVRGDYEWIVRVTAEPFLTRADILARTSIEDLLHWLEHEKGGKVERRPGGPDIDCRTEESVGPPGAALHPAPDSSDSAWIERAMRITEICIDELVLEFLDLPYLHRVEHSIHTRLYSILSNQPHFDRHFALAAAGMLTQPIHKEWPETIPRPEKGNRRGNFDLAILSPGQLRACTLEDFNNGRPAPAVVIEMGLNYKEGHLSHDVEKLLNSQVLHGYVVHLVREKPHESAIDLTIERLRSEGAIKVAFARVERGRKFLKLLDDPVIREL